MYSINKGVYTNKVNKSAVIVSALMIASVVGILGRGPIFAKGGSNSTAPVSFPTSQGPCSYDWTADEGHIAYPLTHDKYPGVVSVDMLYNGTGTPKVNNVCLDAGWTVSGGQVTGGVQLRFSYKGVKAIDFKFVLGKTDIRNY